ncbi:hypothetical protein D6D29_01446 [Aureobasidium pullulans]|nr:hypothetical protein D6D29_01446 [Aureobasidium pullulans]
MQALWSRIAQTGLSCHCPSCVSAGASGVGRRTTTAAGRRPVRWALSSTFVYSGIFAAAATTDAGFKQKRRDQWDRAIADIKHDLDRPTEEKTTVRQEETVKPKPEKEETVRYKPLFDDPQEVILENQSYQDGPAWPTNTGAPLKKGFVPPNSIYAGYITRNRALASRWTSKKVRTTELAVDKLILRMLLHLDDLGCRDEMHLTVPVSCLNLFAAPTRNLKALLLYTNDQHMEATTYPDQWAHINDLPRQHRWGVTYKQDNLGEFHRTAENLNTALGQLFEKKQSGQLAYKDMVAKIAYNFYISPAPPSLECWNTLLCGFMDTDAKNVDLVEPTLSAIRNANVRMNETTLKATLKYFIMINSRTRFANFVDRMRGLHGGVAMARPGITVNDSGRARLVVDPQTGKIYQKPYPTPGVFEVLVQGVLHFVGFEAALRVCKDMGQHGWGLSIRGLTPLLDDRARNADYEAGCQVWDLIKKLQTESQRKGQPEKLFAQTYSAMLRLCSACNEMARFDEVLREARAARYGHQELLDLFRHEMHAEPGIRQLEPGWRNIAIYVKTVTQAEFESIEEKEPEEVSESSSPTSEPSKDASPRKPKSVSGLYLSDDEDWLGSMPSTGNSINKAKIDKKRDDWPFSPSEL